MGRLNRIKTTSIITRDHRLIYVKSAGVYGRNALGHEMSKPIDRRVWQQHAHRTRPWTSREISDMMGLRCMRFLGAHLGTASSTYNTICKTQNLRTRLQGLYPEISPPSTFKVNEQWPFRLRSGLGWRSSVSDPKIKILWIIWLWSLRLVFLDGFLTLVLGPGSLALALILYEVCP